MRRPAGLSLGKAGGWLRREAIHQAARQPGLDSPQHSPSAWPPHPAWLRLLGSGGCSQTELQKGRIHPKRCRLGGRKRWVARRGHHPAHAEGHSLPLRHPGGSTSIAGLAGQAWLLEAGQCCCDRPLAWAFGRLWWGGRGADPVGQAAPSVTAGASHPPFPRCPHGSWTKRPREGR